MSIKVDISKWNYTYTNEKNLCYKSYQVVNYMGDFHLDIFL